MLVHELLEDIRYNGMLKESYPSFDQARAIGELENLLRKVLGSRAYIHDPESLEKRLQKHKAEIVSYISAAQVPTALIWPMVYVTVLYGVWPEFIDILNGHKTDWLDFITERVRQKQYKGAKAFVDALLLIGADWPQLTRLKSALDKVVDK